MEAPNAIDICLFVSQVFLVALFFSLILKKADDDAADDELDEEEPELQYDEQWLAQPNDHGSKLNTASPTSGD
jgi:hypothetical protein